ncbi:MAG TPA: hypothetical protein VD931_09415 [Baekduia sp.]|nr:hypothetical protein [Baekduia sp.]
MRPRDAFFAETEHVKPGDAPGRVCAEMVTPYPPGTPALAPGEVITEALVGYLEEIASLRPRPRRADREALRLRRWARRDPARARTADCVVLHPLAGRQVTQSGGAGILPVCGPGRQRAQAVTIATHAAAPPGTRRATRAAGGRPSP